MPKVTAWQCPRTGKLFKEKRAYKAHLKKVAKVNLAERKHQKIVNSRLDVFKTMRATCKSAAEIEQFVKDNVEVFWAHGLQNSAFDKGKKVPEGLVCHEFRIEAAHKDMVSNSHHCPMNGGVTNWGGDKKDAPRGYPGFHGRVYFKFSHDFPSFCSDMWEGTGLETGTGGGGLKGGSYDIFIFDADWPALADREAASRAEWQEEYDRKKAEWQASYDAAKSKYDAEFPAKKEAFDKEMMEEVLRGKRERVPEYGADWKQRFSHRDFSHPNFKVTL